MERKNINKKLIKFIVIIISLIIILWNFIFLCSIRFRIDYYFLSTVLQVKGYYYPNYDNFDENKENFELLINQIQTFVENTPDFYGEYYADNIHVVSEGIQFIKKETIYPNLIYEIHTPDTNDWENVRSCLFSFPERGFGTIQLNEKYPNCVFFPCSEYSPRIIVYTNAEKPHKYINELWDSYEYVEVIKLANGWYDIRPQGTKQIPTNKLLSDGELAEIVALSLGVPNKKGIEYAVSEEMYYWEAANRYYKNITFTEKGEMVAHASVDIYTGELLRNIFKYNNINANNRFY